MYSYTSLYSCTVYQRMRLAFKVILGCCVSYNAGPRRSFNIALYLASWRHWSYRMIIGDVLREFSEVSPIKILKAEYPNYQRHNL